MPRIFGVLIGGAIIGLIGGTYEAIGAFAEGAPSYVQGVFLGSLFGYGLFGAAATSVIYWMKNARQQRGLNEGKTIENK